jgi:YegS/Rv2252/BmrU family lipid kinase
LLFVNPYSGTKKGLVFAEHAKTFLIAQKINFKEIISDYVGHFSEVILKTDLVNFDLLVIIGGDGTMSEIVNSIFQKTDSQHPPLLLLPAGGGNALNHDLESLDFAKTLQKIKKPNFQKIDIIKLSSEAKIYYSFNIVGWGLVSEITKSSEKLRFLGGLRYFLAAIIHIFKNPKHKAKIFIDNKEYSGNFCFAFFSNTKFTGKSMKMSPLASLTDGKIDMVLVHHQPFWKLLSIFPKIFDGSHINAKEVIYIQSDKAKLESEVSQLVVDGESIFTSPFKVEIIPQALKIII